MTVCNSCAIARACARFSGDGKCAVVLDGDLNYLANSGISCGACYTDCQFSPPS